MTVQNLIDNGEFEVIHSGRGTEREIASIYCCDLLSIAMGRAPEGCAWVTVMGNMNTLAVAALTDAACVVLAEGVNLDEAALKKAREQEITVLKTEKPVFDGALVIHLLLHGGADKLVDGLERRAAPGPVSGSVSGPGTELANGIIDG